MDHPASSGDAFSRQIRGGAEIPAPSSYRHGQGHSIPGTVVRPKGIAHPRTCVMAVTPHSSRKWQVQALEAHEELKAAISCKQRAGQQISLGVGWVGAKAENGFVTPLPKHLGISEALRRDVNIIKAGIKLTALSLPLGVDRDDADMKTRCPVVPVLPQLHTHQQSQNRTLRCLSQRTPDWHHLNLANGGRAQSFDLNLEML